MWKKFSLGPPATHSHTHKPCQCPSSPSILSPTGSNALSKIAAVVLQRPKLKGSFQEIFGAAQKLLARRYSDKQ